MHNFKKNNQETNLLYIVYRNFQIIEAKLKRFCFTTQNDTKGQSTVKSHTTTAKNLGPSKTLNWTTGARVNIWFSVMIPKNISGQFVKSVRLVKFLFAGKIF